ncbi:unnamed protein product [Penicillium salamii]|nr:unnamed protein product [Penicillium salamii]CAG8357985.1 unnamed protein product [Penicillium salamii]
MVNILAHPYWPLEANLVDYVPNTMSVPALLGSFALATLTVIGLTSMFMTRQNSVLSRQDKVLTAWFVFSGCIHLILEGYFVYNHKTMPRMEDLLGQLWKEYALSDSRYMTIEPFVLCMETITAFGWGPLCYLISWMIVTKSPYRHPTQMLVSMGQLYGDVLYYATSMMEDYYHGRSYSRPETYYYWGYFIFMNTFWVFIPGELLGNYWSFSTIRPCCEEETLREKSHIPLAVFIIWKGCHG